MKIRRSSLNFPIWLGSGAAQSWDKIKDFFLKSIVAFVFNFFASKALETSTPKETIWSAVKYILFYPISLFIVYIGWSLIKEGLRRAGKTFTSLKLSYMQLSLDLERAIWSSAIISILFNSCFLFIGLWAGSRFVERRVAAIPPPLTREQLTNVATAGDVIALGRLEHNLSEITCVATAMAYLSESIKKEYEDITPLPEPGNSEQGLLQQQQKKQQYSFRLDTLKYRFQRYLEYLSVLEQGEALYVKSVRPVWSAPNVNDWSAPTPLNLDNLLAGDRDGFLRGLSNQVDKLNRQASGLQKEYRQEIGKLNEKLDYLEDRHVYHLASQGCNP